MYNLLAILTATDNLIQSCCWGLKITPFPISNLILGLTSTSFPFSLEMQQNNLSHLIHSENDNFSLCLSNVLLGQKIQYLIAFPCK